MKGFKEYWKSISGVCLTIILSYTSFNHSFIDHYYSNRLFQYIRIVFDSITSIISFPLFYLVLIGVLSLLGFIMLNKKYSRVSKLISLAGFFCWIYVLFYVLWGFNYSNTNIKTRLNLDSMNIDETYLKDEIIKTIDTLTTIRNSIKEDSFALEINYEIQEIIDLIRPDLESVLKDAGYVINRKPIIKLLSPKGVLLRISTAGFYFPFGGEGYIDKGLHTIQWPSTIAHELSHGYGVTDEGECNFIAVLACIANDDVRVQYSGQLMYFQYLCSAMGSDSNLVKEVKLLLSKAVLNDLEAIYAELDKYPDIFPSIRIWIYDQYLKTNGIMEGIKSYRKVVELMASYRAKMNRFNQAAKEI